MKVSGQLSVSILFCGWPIPIYNSGLRDERQNVSYCKSSFGIVSPNLYCISASFNRPGNFAANLPKVVLTMEIGILGNYTIFPKINTFLNLIKREIIKWTFRVFIILSFGYLI